MRIVLGFALLLSACGVDGPPQPPSSPPGMTISGTLHSGIAKDGG